MANDLNTRPQVTSPDQNDYHHLYRESDGTTADKKIFTSDLMTAANNSFDDATALLGAVDVQAMGEALEKKTERQTVVVRSVADFGAPVTRPDGVSAYLLKKRVRYVKDAITIFLDRPFLLEDAAGDTFGGPIIDNAGTGPYIYLGTAPLLYSVDAPTLRMERAGFVAVNPNVKLFHLVKALDSSLQFLETKSFVSFGFDDLGLVSHYSFGDLDFTGIQNYKIPLKMHDIGQISIDKVQAFNTVSANNPQIVITGAPYPRFSLISTFTDGMQSGESIIAIDSQDNIGTYTVTSNQFFGNPGTSFFQLDLTGTITGYQDLSTLISGTVSLYEDDGLGNVKVTHTGSVAYEGLNVTHSGTTNYNGTFSVLRNLGNNQYIMSATYVSDEVSGSFVGSGIRVTTASPHKLTDYRTTAISGTTNYNQSGIVVYNTSTSTFDTNQPFLGNDATGTYLTQSLNQASLNVDASSNDALEDSKKVGNTSLSVQRTVTITQGVYSPINGTNWVDGELEEFTATNAGVLTYIGDSPVNVIAHSSATVSKVGGGADVIATRIRVNGVPQAVSQGQTQNASPTQVTGFLNVTLNKNDQIDLSVTNVTGSPNVIVDLGSLIIK